MVGGLPLTARRRVDIPIIDRVSSPVGDAATGTIIGFIPSKKLRRSHEQEDGADQVPRETSPKCSTTGQAVLKKMLVWCLLCDGPIRSENDIMPNGNTHNCTERLRLEF
jgi:hypothetical protein